MAISDNAPDADLWRSYVEGDTAVVDELLRRNRESVRLLLGRERRLFTADDWQEVSMKLMLYCENVRWLKNTPPESLSEEFRSGCNDPQYDIHPDADEDHDCSGDARLRKVRFLKRIVQKAIGSRRFSGRPEDFTDFVQRECSQRVYQFNVVAWLIKVTKTTIAQRLRKENQIFQLDGEQGDAPRSFSERFSDEDRSTLNDCISGLGEDDQRLIRMRYIGMADNEILSRVKRHREIGAEVGMTENAVGKRLKQITEALKACVQRKQGDLA